jgi:hypothetical protein
VQATSATAIAIAAASAVDRDTHRFRIAAAPPENALCNTTQRAAATWPLALLVVVLAAAGCGKGGLNAAEVSDSYATVCLARLGITDSLGGLTDVIDRDEYTGFDDRESTEFKRFTDALGAEFGDELSDYSDDLAEIEAGVARDVPRREIRDDLHDVLQRVYGSDTYGAIFDRFDECADFLRMVRADIDRRDLTSGPRGGRH